MLEARLKETSTMVSFLKILIFFFAFTIILYNQNLLPKVLLKNYEWKKVTVVWVCELKCYYYDAIKRPSRCFRDDIFLNCPKNR